MQTSREHADARRRELDPASFVRLEQLKRLHATDRAINFHVRQDGRIVVVVYAYGTPISRTVLSEGWRYASVLLDRVACEWAGMPSRVTVTFEA